MSLKNIRIGRKLVAAFAMVIGLSIISNGVVLLRSNLLKCHELCPGPDWDNNRTACDGQQPSNSPTRILLARIAASAEF